MRKHVLTALLALVLCMSLIMPAMASDPYGPQNSGFYVAEKFYSFDEPSSGEGWSYDGNYTMTLSGIQSTYGKNEYGVIYDWIQLNNPEKDFTFVVQDGTDNNVGNIDIIYGGLTIRDSQRKAVTFSGTGTLNCKNVHLDKIHFSNVTLNVKEYFSCWGLYMDSGTINASSFSMGHVESSLKNLYSFTGGRIELKGEKTSDYYNGVIRVDGLEEDLLRDFLSNFKDANGNPLEVEMNENTVYGGYYCFVKDSETGEKATYAIFEGAQVPDITFTDVPAEEYYAAPVAWAVEKGITAGTSDTTFSPDDTCTKAQIITFLWRAAGSPEPQSAGVFSDVAQDAYYAKATAWAAENGMADGSTFAPEDPCTRQMAVEFMWKHAGSPDAAAASFTDVSSDAVDWALANGVTSGTSDTTFSPNDTCTRAQIVTFLYRAFA